MSTPTYIEYDDSLYSAPTHAAIDIDLYHDIINVLEQTAAAVIKYDGNQAIDNGCPLDVIVRGRVVCEHTELTEKIMSTLKRLKDNL